MIQHHTNQQTQCCARVTVTLEYQFKNQFLTSDDQFLDEEISSHEQKNARIRSTDMHNLS